MQHRAVTGSEIRLGIHFGTYLGICGLAAAVMALAGCANPPTAQKQIGSPVAAGLQVSALEAQGPLELPFASPQRWLNFPMYHNDSAHAVDLGALRWRSDTLLLSASRYPLHDGASWPKELYERAWYVYVKRLIDCQNGNDAQISEALLDQQGQTLLERATRSSPRANQERRAEPGRWLRASEIGLACLAAASPQLLAQRRAAAAEPPPKLSYLPMSAVLQADVSALRARTQFHADAAQLQPASLKGASAILSGVAQQQSQWQRDLHGPAVDFRPSEVPWAEEKERKALEAALNRHGDELPFRALPRGEYERWEDVRGRQVAPPLPEGVPVETVADAELVALRQGSCMANVAVTTRYRWYGWRSQKLLAERAATPDEMLGSLQPASELCEQLRMRASSLDRQSTEIQPGETAQTADWSQIQARIKELMRAEQTQEVSAQILLEWRKAMSSDGAER